MCWLWMYFILSREFLVTGMSLQYAASRVRRFLAGAYQYSFPAPFRIVPSVAVAWQMSAAWAAIAVLAPFGKVVEEYQQRLTKNDGGITEEFAKGLCNEHFRLVSHLAQLERMTDPPRPVRRLRTAAEYLQQTFEQQGVEYRNLTGQDYHEGRLDFENIAPAEVDPSLTTPKIVVCEYPAVFLRGRLIQTARGIVARPP
ncbi:hypothetical protein CCP3SC15_90021 [Gammaproteobacteria bacterium]